MEILKIVGIGIVTCISSILVKQIKPEFNILIIICGCVLILLCIINGLNTVFKGFSGISKLLKIDNEMLKTIIKIIGVGYIVEFGASICNDSGHTAVAEKIVLAGKISILAMCIPIISSLFKILLELMP